jgi:hypothetical protein
MTRTRAERFHTFLLCEEGSALATLYRRLAARLQSGPGAALDESPPGWIVWRGDETRAVPAER